MYSPKTKDERKALLVILSICGIILFAIALFYVLNPRNIVGDSLVNNLNGTPVEFPPASTSPFYLKPVTILYVAGILFAFCLFALAEAPIRKLSRTARILLMLAFVMGVAICTYETLFNFVLWASLLVTHPDPDTLVNSYPIKSYKVNLVFATKSFVALLFITYFGYSAFKKSLESDSA